METLNYGEFMDFHFFFVCFSFVLLFKFSLQSVKTVDFVTCHQAVFSFRFVNHSLHSRGNLKRLSIHARENKRTAKN